LKSALTGNPSSGDLIVRPNSGVLTRNLEILDGICYTGSLKQFFDILEDFNCKIWTIATKNL
jgi:hypothetical protein